jgi:hypothetical protein
MGRPAQVHAAFSGWQNFSSAAGTGLMHTLKAATCDPQSHYKFGAEIATDLMGGT